MLISYLTTDAGKFDAIQINRHEVASYAAGDGNESRCRIYCSEGAAFDLSYEELRSFIQALEHIADRILDSKYPDDEPEKV